ncbi:hypothetical protein [Gimesia aquarii]|uniref:Uncharacterized protein n=1 Tax=Gimesia aquarii TaxID=2527964 RepID=A0A517VRH2_9PLAN|nr:hypothetical protein [Gimesia aquarii]QDT95530.1 hypothetical protein V144x_09750 [Gimesia aquarii]
MARCPSHDWDDHCRREEDAMSEYPWIRAESKTEFKDGERLIVACIDLDSNENLI